MRIISGTCRGRRLVQIQGREIRPTSDRVREAIFNILNTRVRHARVLDLFAGTGALGLEALSRGAKGAVFVDASKASCQVIKKNTDQCRMSDKARIICQDIIVEPLPRKILQDRFDLVFMDPPYDKDLVKKVLEKKFLQQVLSPNGMVVAEHSQRENLGEAPRGLDFFRQKKYSKTKISFFTPTQD